MWSYFLYNKEINEWIDDVCVLDVGEGRDGLFMDDFWGFEFCVFCVFMYVIIVVYNLGIFKIN